jgi:predicted GNAT superfamily acetyltransferase
VSVSAWDEARDAAAAANVHLQIMQSVDHVEIVRSLIQEIWGQYAVIPPNFLRAVGMAGSASLIAFRHSTPVGFALGCLGWDKGVHFHSHQVGVLESCRGEGVGLAIKLWQRAICLDNGVTQMRWTFDPLLLGNARFNLLQLGAQVEEFLPNCYGVRDDNFNAGDITDRVKVSWDLTRKVGQDAVPSERGEVIEIPSDYLQLKKYDPTRAQECRGRVGSQFAIAVATGRRVIGLCESGYVIGLP